MGFTARTSLGPPVARGSGSRRDRVAAPLWWFAGLLCALGCHSAAHPGASEASAAASVAASAGTEPTVQQPVPQSEGAIDSPGDLDRGDEAHWTLEASVHGSSEAGAIEPLPAATTGDDPPRTIAAERGPRAPALFQGRSLPLLAESAPEGSHPLPRGNPLGEFADRLLAAAPPPVGLAPTRFAEREQQRAVHLAAVAEELAGAEGAARLGQLCEWLADPRTDAELWIATARTVGELGLQRPVIDLVWALDEPAGSRLRAAARRALHQCFGLWFQSRADFEPFSAGLDDPLRLAYRSALLELERQELEHREAAWLDPDLALQDARGGTPRLRAAAARALLRHQRAGALVGPLRDGVFAALASQAADEGDPTALEAQLELLSELALDLGPSDPRLGELREALCRGLAGSAQAALPAVARTLSALPLDESPAVLARCAGALVQALRLRLRARPRDPDISVALLAALRRVAADAGAEATSEALAPGELVGSVLDLAGGREVPASVRRAAVAALADLATPADLGAVAERLNSPELDTSLRFDLLGVLAALAAPLEPGDARAAAALAVARAQLGAEELDLRRRALELLAAPAVQALVGESELEALLRQLERETSPELQVSLLTRLRRSGSAATLESILALPPLGDDAALNESLAATVARLCGDDLSLRVRGARRVAAAANLRATELALELLLVAPVEQAERFEAEDHGAAVHWALQLLDAGEQPTVPAQELDAAATAQLLLDRHLGRATTLTDLDRARASALLAEAAGLPLAAITAGLARALEQASGAADRSILLRDRARIRARTGLLLPAFDDWRDAAAAGLAPGELNLDRLSSADLRGALSAAGVQGAAPAVPAPGAPPALDPDRARCAVAFGLELLDRPDWVQNPVALCLADLEALASAVWASGDPELRERVRARLEPQPPGSDRALFDREELRTRAAELRAALALP
jgi:hypothetical protein